MRKDIADLWIADLRSNPPKTKRVLFDGKGYCCLGRLCIVLGLKPDENNKFDGSSGILPNSIKKKAEMKGRNGDYNRGDNMLTKDNDSGKSFAEIADIIEKHWEEL